MQPKAAIFDVFGTVVDWRGGVAAEVARAYARKGVAVDAGAFADAWRRRYDPAMAPIREGRRGYTALDVLHRENLDDVLDERGEGDLFDEADRADLARAWERLPPWPDAFDGLTALRRCMPIATCSNGSIALMTRLARFGGLPWDCILGAEIAQSYKPDPAVYHAACAALQLAPGEVVMVACHNDDLAAARASGLLTAWLPRPDEWGIGHGAPPPGPWDWVVEDLTGLAPAMSHAQG